MNDADDMEELTTFTDAIDAGMACDCLDAAEIPFKIEDHSLRPEGYSNFRIGPLIRMTILVQKEVLERAKVCLREKMHLFPLAEIAEDYEGDSSDNDEVSSEAIICDQLSDAEAAKSALDDAGIWSAVRRLVDDEDGIVSYSVEVKGKDIERAVRVVDQRAESRR
jgi:hypothetical protein